jgi:hypothetical protein
MNENHLDSTLRPGHATVGMFFHRERKQRPRAESSMVLRTVSFQRFLLRTVRRCPAAVGIGMADEPYSSAVCRRSAPGGASPSGFKSLHRTPTPTIYLIPSATTSREKLVP